MNDKLDELAKGMAQSVTRRGALKKFGVGLAGIALAALGLANNAQAGLKGCYHKCKNRCGNDYDLCFNTCLSHCVGF